MSLATAVKIALAFVQEPDAIEAYHWLYARHLAAGYYDHPGMIGWWVKLSTATFGHSLIALRLPTIAGSACAIWIAFLAGRRMYDERAGRLAAFLVGLVPLLARFSSEAAPDGPLLLFWTCSLWALAHALDGGDRRWWLAAGLFVGAAMDSKYTAAYLPAAVAAYLALSPEHRSWFRRPEPYLAGLVAMVVFSPTLVWNAQNEWQSFSYQGLGRLHGSDTFDLNHAWVFFRRQVGLVTPFVLAGVIATSIGIVRRWTQARWCDRFNLVCGLPLLLLFFALSLFRSVRAHWPAPAYLSLILLSASAVSRGAGVWRALHHGTLILLAAAGTALPIYLATLPSEQRQSWEPVAAHVRRLGPDFVMAVDYHDAAQLAFHLHPIKAWDLTPAGFGGKSFRNWWRPENYAGRNAVVVLPKNVRPEELEAVRRCFARLEGPERVEMTAWRQAPRTLELWVGHDYRPPAGTSSGTEIRDPAATNLREANEE